MPEDPSLRRNRQFLRYLLRAAGCRKLHHPTRIEHFVIALGWERWREQQPETTTLQISKLRNSHASLSLLLGKQPSKASPSSYSAMLRRTAKRLRQNPKLRSLITIQVEGTYLTFTFHSEHYKPEHQQQAIDSDHQPDAHFFNVLSKSLQGKTIEILPFARDFLTPPNTRPICLITHTATQYDKHPYNEDRHEGFSTRVQFALDALNAILLTSTTTPSSDPRRITVDSLVDKRNDSLLSADLNVISYASPKVNRCTEEIMRRLENQHDRILHFAPIDQSGRAISAYQPKEPESNDLWGLVYNDHTKPLIHRPGVIDYGIVIRAHPGLKDPRVWWVFAGCSLPGSVAASNLVFEPQRCSILADRMISPLPRSFALIFSVEYEISKKMNPKAPKLLDFFHF